MCIWEERTPYSTRTDPLFLLWEDVIVIVTCGSFNHALIVLTHVRFGQVPLRTRLLILVAHGLTEALLQPVLNCLKTDFHRTSMNIDNGSFSYSLPGRESVFLFSRRRLSRAIRRRRIRCFRGRCRRGRRFPQTGTFLTDRDSGHPVAT